LTLAISSAVTVLTWPVLLLACNANSRYKLGEKSIAYPLLMIAAIGTLRGLFVQGVVSLLNLDDGLTPINGALTSTAFTVIYFVGISCFIELLNHKKKHFNQIFSASAALLVKSSDQLMANSVEATYANAVASVKASVSQNIKGNAVTGLIDIKSASLEIQKQINEVLRPLSHRLWINSLGEIKFTNMSIIAKDAISDIQFNPRQLLIYQLVVGGIGITLIKGIATALYISISALLVSCTLIFLFYKFKPRVKKYPLALGCAFLFSIGILPVYVPIAIFATAEQGFNFSGLVLSITLPGLIALSSTYRLISKDQDFAVSAATSIGWQMANYETLSTQGNAQEELAKYFHNSLQSELFGIAKKLESLDASNEQNEVQSLLSSFNVALDRGYQDTVPKETNGVARIASLIESWKGICVISVTGIETLTANSPLAYQVSKLMGEMITNSIRYGKATQMEFSLTRTNAMFEILLTHDGEPPAVSEPGLGTLLISRHAREGVVTQVRAGKTFYKISLP
jgi:signal transduction histidine kinase